MIKAHCCDENIHTFIILLSIEKTYIMHCKKRKKISKAHSTAKIKSCIFSWNALKYLQIVAECKRHISYHLITISMTNISKVEDINWYGKFSIAYSIARWNVLPFVWKAHFYLILEAHYYWNIFKELTGNPSYPA